MQKTLLVILLIAQGFTTQAQSIAIAMPAKQDTLAFTIVTKDKKEGATPFVQIEVWNNGKVIAKAMTDMNGKAKIVLKKSEILKAKLEIKTFYVGYEQSILKVRPKNGGKYIIMMNVDALKVITL